MITAFTLVMFPNLGTCMEKKGWLGIGKGIDMNYQCLCYIGGDGRIFLPFPLIGKKLCSIKNG